jgi:hypothetical protein
MAFVAGTCGNTGTYSVINGFTGAIEVAPSSADGVGGYLPCTGADVTPGVSHSNVNRQSVIGFVVQVGAGGPVPPGPAVNPSPTDSATDVSIDVTLSWTAGTDATSHDVYFGTAASPPFIVSQSGTSYDPGTLFNDTVYYWRIDEVGAGGTRTGAVWSFTTQPATPPPGQASNPSPANGATNQSVNVDLSWTAGTDATSHDVHFGTDSTPDSGEFQGNQTNTTFDPGTLANDTTYYWRIDSKNAIGTTTGVVWNFTTEAASGPDAFLQDAGADGIVSMEAENYDDNISQGGHDWNFITSPSGFSGSGAMRSEPDSGTNNDTGYAANSPRLDFQVNFVKTGTHYIWIRALKVGGSDDSFHAGIDGQENSTANRIQVPGSNNVWNWSGDTMDSTRVYVDVPSTGVHTVNIWMREDGSRADKIVLTTNSAYTPSGNGPAESPRGGGASYDADIPQTSTAPSIDGSVDSVWSSATANSIENLILGTISSGSDLSGTWKAMWDSTHFYYLVEITDDALTNDSASSWDDDTIEIFVDADNSKGTSYDGVNDFQYGFRYSDGTVHIGTNSVNDSSGVNFSLVATAGGYNLEVEIPWSTLGVTPSAGALIGTDIQVNDDDDGDARDGKMAWYCTDDNAWQDPSLLATAELTH